jgi:hypothetical protein
LQIRHRARVKMTLRADDFRMFARQFEFEPGVIEIIPIAIHAIMTIEAGRTKR